MLLVGGWNVRGDLPAGPHEAGLRQRASVGLLHAVVQLEELGPTAAAARTVEALGDAPQAVVDPVVWEPDFLGDLDRAGRSRRGGIDHRAGRLWCRTWR